MPSEITAIIKAVRVVNDRSRQYPSGLVISNYLEVDLVDADGTGEVIPTIAGLAWANEAKRDMYLRNGAGLFIVSVQLGERATDGRYELLSAKVVLD